MKKSILKKSAVQFVYPSYSGHCFILFYTLYTMITLVYVYKTSQIELLNIENLLLQNRIESLEYDLEIFNSGYTFESKQMNILATYVVIILTLSIPLSVIIMSEVL